MKSKIIGAIIKWSAIPALATIIFFDIGEYKNPFDLVTYLTMAIWTTCFALSILGLAFVIGEPSKKRELIPFGKTDTSKLNAKVIRAFVIAALLIFSGYHFAFIWYLGNVALHFVLYAIIDNLLEGKFND